MSPKATVFLYNGGLDSATVQELTVFIGQKFDWLAIVVRPEFASFAMKTYGQPVDTVLDRLSSGWATAKIRRFDQVGSKPPISGEIDYERRRLANGKSTWGLVYQAPDLMRLFWGFLLTGERHPNMLHVIVSNQLIASWDKSDRRYHLRTIFLGAPCIISIPGLVEAPARSAEFYLARELGVRLYGQAPASELLPGSGLGHGDSRLTELAKGYIAQAIMYYFAGEPFCADRNCRLFNAHRQEDVIRAQLEGDYEFCSRHEEINDRLRSLCYSRTKPRFRPGTRRYS